jgi:hypothetical protein
LWIEVAFATESAMFGQAAERLREMHGLLRHAREHFVLLKSIGTPEQIAEAHRLAEEFQPE